MSEYTKTERAVYCGTTLSLLRYYIILYNDIIMVRDLSPYKWVVKMLMYMWIVRANL